MKFQKKLLNEINGFVDVYKETGNLKYLFIVAQLTSFLGEFDEATKLMGELEATAIYNLLVKEIDNEF